MVYHHVDGQSDNVGENMREKEQKRFDFAVSHCTVLQHGTVLYGTVMDICYCTVLYSTVPQVKSITVQN